MYVRRRNAAAAIFMTQLSSLFRLKLQVVHAQRPANVMVPMLVLELMLMLVLGLHHHMHL